MWKSLKAYIGIAIMYKYFNPNPCGKNVSDCTVRLCMQGYLDGDLPNANACWGAYLRSIGYRRHIIPDTCPDCYTVARFAEEHPKGTYILALSGHVVCVQDGVIFDSWDSGGEVPLYYWTTERME